MTIRELKPFCPFGMMGSMRAVPLSGAINFRQPAEISAERRQAVMTKWKKELFS